MKSTGLGVMIQMVGGDKESGPAIARATGKTIEGISITDEELVFKFRDGTGLWLRDEGQSCCEHRYMHTDDDLEPFHGSEFRGAEIRPGGSEDNYYGYKDSEFLIIHTSRGDFTVVNYNEHNGYYGGFWIIAREEKK